MKLTTKVRYAVSAMCDLALNNGTCSPVQIKDVANRQNLSVQYLEQLFNKLKKARLIRTTRGPKGGYMLAERPSKIIIGDIYRTFEGPIALVGCIENGAGRMPCVMSGRCSTKPLWKKLSGLIENVLDSTSLEDLVK